MNKQFRIIALRTLNECVVDERNLYKVLSSNTIYPFYNFYKFPENNFENIKIETDEICNIYKLEECPEINISAIVGANGSGKSSLIELFLMANYNLACYVGLLKECNCDESDENCNCDDEENKIALLPKTGFCVEILFSNSENALVLLNFFEGQVKKHLYILKNGIYVKGEGLSLTKSELQAFCYSIMVNYSHHSLNSKEIGDWINPLFHKNDGYQAPLVINPMRNEGNIDINKENELLLDRLMSNILEPIDKKNLETLRNIAPSKIATEISIKFNKYKVAKSYYKKEKGDENLIPEAIKLKAIAFGLEEWPKQLKMLQNSTSKTKLLETFNLDLLNEKYINDEYYIWGTLYLFSKGYSIVNKYITHKEKADKFSGFDYKLLKEDSSHVAFKFKRVVYFLKYFEKWKNLLSKGEVLTVDEVSSLICEIQIIESMDYKSNYSPKIIELLPPSFFEIDILLNNGLKYSDLSSGEKQKIQSVSSIIYHIINLNSVKPKTLKNNDIYLKYENINIVLDEIELYFHPNWQRTFINDLLESIKKINKQYIASIAGLNFIFVTHSPFILSDIPHQNILLLDIDPNTKKSKPKELITKTLGANIHELLADNFYMESTIGEYIKRKIQKILNFHLEIEDADNKELFRLRNLYETLHKDEFKYIINNIGEDIIKSTLENHIEYIEESLFQI